MGTIAMAILAIALFVAAIVCFVLFLVKTIKVRGKRIKKSRRISIKRFLHAAVIFLISSIVVTAIGIRLFPVAPDDFPTAEELLIALSEKNENFGDMVVYNEETDPNGNLGRPGEYTSKADFSDNRIEQYSDDDLKGGTIEVFENRENCSDRADYLSALNDPSMGVFGVDEYIYEYDYVVFRVSYDLTPEQAEEYHKQMDEIINGWEETGEIITNVKNVDGEKAVQVSEKNEEIDAENQTRAEEIYDKMKYEADEQAKSLGFDNSMAEVVSDEFENSYGFVRGLEGFSGNEGEDLARFLIALSYFELNFDEGTLGNAVGEKGWEAIKSLIFDDGEFQSKMDEMKELYEAGGNRLFESSYNEGQYKVGEDIPSGEYVLFADYSVAYFAITEDSNAENIISNGNFEYNSIICVNDGEYLELSMCKAVPIEEVDDLPIDNANMFKVGTHLPAGEYKLVSDSDIGYYAIYNDSRHQDIVSNNNFQSQSYVTVEDGQYLLLSMCHIETK